MKSRDKERLQQDFLRYCEQIGIRQIPKLVLEKSEHNTIRRSYGMRRTNDCYGECYVDKQLIFIDTKAKTYQYRTYPKRPNKRYLYKVRTVKGTYRTKIHTLVHELVHYRFQSLQHGRKFEDRIKEVLRGQTFPTPIQEKERINC